MSVNFSVLKTETNYGCSDEFDGGEKLIFHYAGKRSLSCKTINVYDLSKSGSGKPVDWKFQDKATQWQEFETVYDMEDVFNLQKSSGDTYDIEENFDVSFVSRNESFCPMHCRINMCGFAINILLFPLIVSATMLALE